MFGLLQIFNWTYKLKLINKHETWHDMQMSNQRFHIRQMFFYFKIQTRLQP